MKLFLTRIIDLQADQSNDDSLFKKVKLSNLIACKKGFYLNNNSWTACPNEQYQDCSGLSSVSYCKDCRVVSFCTGSSVKDYECQNNYFCYHPAQNFPDFVVACGTSSSCPLNEIDTKYGKILLQKINPTKCPVGYGKYKIKYQQNVIEDKEEVDVCVPCSQQNIAQFSHESSAGKVLKNSNDFVISTHNQNSANYSAEKCQ